MSPTISSPVIQMSKCPTLNPRFRKEHTRQFEGCSFNSSMLRQIRLYRKIRSLQKRAVRPSICAAEFHPITRTRHIEIHVCRSTNRTSKDVGTQTETINTEITSKILLPIAERCKGSIINAISRRERMCQFGGCSFKSDFLREILMHRNIHLQGK